MVTWRGTDDGFVTPAVHEIYLRYAMGGPGMIVLEATGIRDVASGPLLRLCHDRFVPGLRALVAEMRAASDALVVPQIIDFLKIATRKPTRVFMEGLVAAAASRSPCSRSPTPSSSGTTRATSPPRQQRDFLYGYRQTIEDLDLAEIRRIPGWFAAAARRARDCGFDGVELHFAHAYTMASFLSVTNGRTDAYGGSFENRLRLPLEVVRAVREETGPDFVVGCRFLGSEDILGPDGEVGGNTLADARADRGRAGARGRRLPVHLARAASSRTRSSRPSARRCIPYTGHSGATCIPRSRKDPAGVNTYLADGIRQAVRAAGLTTPVVTAGKIDTFDQAEAILRDGRADLIGMARALLADPDLPRKWRAGADADARECVFCPYCEDEDQHHRVVTCTLWPKDPRRPSPARHPRRLAAGGRCLARLRLTVPMAGSRLGPGTVAVAFAHTSPAQNEAALAAVARLLSPEEQARAARFLFDDDRRRFAVTRALVRRALSACVDVAPEQWRIEADAHGRPFVAGPPAGGRLRFSAAHTAGLGMCAVTVDRAIGADVERLRADAPLEVATHLFAPAEAESVRAAPPAEQAERFFTLWTLKECYAKARGLGLSLPLDQFAFDMSGGEPRVSFSPALGDDASAWQFIAWRPTPDHRAALCVERQGAATVDLVVRWLDAASGGAVEAPGSGQR